MSSSMQRHAWRWILYRVHDQHIEKCKLHHSKTETKYSRNWNGLTAHTKCNLTRNKIIERIYASPTTCRHKTIYLYCTMYLTDETLSVACNYRYDDDQGHFISGYIYIVTMIKTQDCRSATQKTFTPAAICSSS